MIYQNWNRLITVILNDPPRSFSKEKFWSPNAHFETKSFTELISEHLIKLERKIDKIFSKSR